MQPLTSSELWFAAGLMLVTLVALHIQYIPLNTGEPLRQYWSNRQSYRASKLCFVLALVACPLIVISPYLGGVIWAVAFIAHGLLALRR